MKYCSKNKWILIAVCACHRRIVGGVYTAFDKQYMVYFVKSTYTKPKVDGPSIGDYWLCGGAIVSPTQILTSAACLLENNNIYAIAGYRKYVRTHDLETDECTKRWKQKVVKICTPKEYKFEHSKPMQWLSMDVGVAIVEKPYNFSDLTYRLHCSYVPAPVKILYEEVYQAEGVDVLMLGWGHAEARQPHNILDLNSLYLREASGMIQPKSHCRSNFHTIIMEELINKYLICVHYGGNIAGNGEVSNIGEVTNTGCTRRNMGQKDSRCVNDTFMYDDYDFDFRRNVNQTDGLNAKRQLNVSSHEKLMNTRRQGICQNDHGGPLITWVGKEEVLIGVALTALLSDKYECVGPFIFTSAYCASMIIQCLLITNVALRTSCEDKVKEKGYGIEEKTFKWGDVNRERKPKETDFKMRQLEPLYQQNNIKEILPQPLQPLYAQPIVQSYSNVISPGQQTVPSLPNIPLHPHSVVHLLPQPNVPLPSQFAWHPKSQFSLRQRTLISQQAPLRSQSVITSPQHVSYKPNVIFNKVVENEYAKIKNVGFRD